MSQNSLDFEQEFLLDLCTIYCAVCTGNCKPNNYKRVPCMTRKGKDLIGPVAEARILACRTPFCRIAFWPCSMSGNGTYLCHVQELWCHAHSRYFPSTVSNCMRILSQEIVTGTKHQRTGGGKHILRVIILCAAFWLVLTSQTLESTACIRTCIILGKHVTSE